MMLIFEVSEDFGDEVQEALIKYTSDKKPKVSKNNPQGSFKEIHEQILSSIFSLNFGFVLCDTKSIF